MTTEPQISKRQARTKRKLVRKGVPYGRCKDLPPINDGGPFIKEVWFHATKGLRNRLRLKKFQH